MFVDKAPSFGGADAARRSASPLEDAARIFKEGEIRNSTRKGQDPSFTASACARAGSL